MNDFPNSIKDFKENVSGKYSPPLGPAQRPQDIQLITYPTEEGTSEVKAAQESDVYHFYPGELTTNQTTISTASPKGSQAVIADEPEVEQQANTDPEGTELPASPPTMHRASPMPTTGPFVATNQETPQDTELPNGKEIHKSGQTSPQQSQEKQQIKWTKYPKEVGPFAVTTASLSNSLATISLSTVKTEHFQARVILHPNMAEKGTGNCSARVQLRLAVSVKEKLKRQLLSKTVTSCKVGLSTKVKEKGTDKLLAKYDNQQFQLPPQGIANCLCELITNKELDESNSKKVDIYVTITTYIQDWEPKIMPYGDDYWQIT